MRFRLSLGAAFCVVCLPAVSAVADEMPRRKPGLWSMEFVTQGAPSPTGGVEMCIDEKTDDIMRQNMGDQTQQCEKLSFTRDGDKYRVGSICKLDKSVTKTEGVFTGSFDSAYRGEFHITYTPPIHNLASTDLVIEAKWLGPCKPGQKPGDIVMPGLKGGGQMNMQELMKKREQLRKGAQ
ncbi:DUF3617 family protein [Methylosinus sp. H3A]|uniref:DUF3617 domain-containing protein n=1 Tax=Methylosinus sp. H3A TaxID=2785786 RepID=UPI0018C1D218|nr:DUF3617 family protein [Methylosinus sp. H3A]MBG0809668.1 DUF3617 family protein [Methylosinus sp. H3A]